MLIKEAQMTHFRSLIILTLVLFSCQLSGTTFAQTTSIEKTLPDVMISTLDGTKVSAKTLHNDGQPVIIIFWATWCHHTVDGLSEIANYYEEWQEETGVKIIAISTDDSRSSAKVKSFVQSRGWEFDVYLDPNGNMTRSLNVTGAPFILLYDGDFNEEWRHATFLSGDEDVLYEKLTLVSK